VGSSNRPLPLRGSSPSMATRSADRYFELKSQIHRKLIGVLNLERVSSIPKDRVHFFKADAISLDGAPSGCDAAFAGFWWSHVKKSGIEQFVANLSARLEPGARVVVLDNQFAEGSSTPISRRDAEGNTYQMRHLASGEQYEVLKNFPSGAELADAVRPVASEAHLETLTYYWLLVFTLK